MMRIANGSDNEDIENDERLKEFKRLFSSFVVKEIPKKEDLDYIRIKRYVKTRPICLISEGYRNELSKDEQIAIAKNILKTCYWGNTNYTPEYIVENIHNKFFARKIFSAILENSKFMTMDLAIMDERFVVEFLKDWQNKPINFNKERTRLRLDALINAYIDSSYQLRDMRWN